MSQVLINMIAKRALKDVALKNTNSKNPYFDETPIYGNDGKPTGKVKQQKKAVPVGISQNDGQVLKKVRRRAYRLDMSLFSIFGIRFGWSSVIGFIPVIGDFIDMIMAWNVVRTCAQIDGGLPSVLKSRMYFNIILDFGLGLVPFLGDLVDAVFRANTRNCWLLEEYLVKKAQEEQKLPPGQKLTGPGSEGLDPAVPAPAKTASQSKRGSWFGRSRQPDEELALGTLNNTQQPRR